MVGESVEQKGEILRKKGSFTEVTLISVSNYSVQEAVGNLGEIKIFVSVCG